VLSNSGVEDPWFGSFPSPQQMRREEVVNDFPYPFSTAHQMNTHESKYRGTLISSSL